MYFDYQIKYSIIFSFLKGFEWNKYNQTHYDMENPPPKIVQGYKFNVSIEQTLKFHFCVFIFQVIVIVSSL